MAKKFLGQHFLSDPRILGRIRAALPAKPGDSVLEIGPGKGALTRELVAAGFRVSAIERDRDLVPALRAVLPSVGLIEGDALAVDWAALASPAGEPWFLIGNIPYNITTPLIDRVFDWSPWPVSVVFLVQKEVALRLAAAAGSETYGALSVGVQASATVERLFNVPAGAFHPPPKVDSAVVRLTPFEPTARPRDPAGFRRTVTGLFGARRKQLIRGLRTGLGLSAASAQQTLAAAGIDGTRRPETLTVAEFLGLHRCLVASLTGTGSPE